MTLPFAHLRVRSEYAFREAYGRVSVVLDRVIATQTPGMPAVLTDPGTWGHPAWRDACAAKGVRPVYGVELPVVANPDDRVKQPGAKMVFLAKNADGLAALYRLVAKASARFYYTARLGYRDVLDAVTCDGNVIVLAGAGARLDLLPASSGVYLMLSPTSPAWNARVHERGFYPHVLVADARYPEIDDQPMYEVHAGRFKHSGTVPLHLPTLAELRALVPQAPDDAVLNTARIMAEIADDVVDLPRVDTVKFENAMGRVRKMCAEGVEARALGTVTRYEGGPPVKVVFHDAAYAARLARELDVIEAKGFADYFVLVADLVQWAKRHMLVGPGRGSSAGSLVCYLLGITDVDPLPHGLLFERFIDVTRTDWPDIDVDFPDVQRDAVFAYLTKTYGERHVARLGTIQRYKIDSAINRACSELNIPAWEVKPFQQRIPPKPDGDTTYTAIAEALETDSLGQQLLDQYPGLIAAARLEGHANTSGTHPAGVVVADRPLDEVCGIDADRVVMVDKQQAEAIGMLKVDALGLTTLAVLDECLRRIGQSRDWLLARPLDDAATYAIFQRERTAGIFQFEGQTQGGLLKRMRVETFADITALGALSRPGPLDAGATAQYLDRRMGREAVRAIHPTYDRITAETFGIIAYQEQMMAILREVGGFDWPTVSKLRKAINKKMGEEWFEGYRAQFVAGAGANDMAPETANRVWSAIVTFGEYAFNKSHAVAYGLLGYWCAYLKAHHGLDFACAVLNNAKSDEAAVKVLRDLVREGYSYVAVDPERSGLTWDVVDGALVGGLTTVVGIGDAMAREVLACRRNGLPLRDALAAKLAQPVTPFDDIFRMRRRFADLYDNPTVHRIVSGAPREIRDVDGAGEFLFLGEIKERELREKVKDGVIHHYVKFLVADDTGEVWVRINTREYPRFGRPLGEAPEREVIGKALLVRGKIYDDGQRIVNVEKIRWLDPKPKLPDTKSHGGAHVPA